MSETLSHKDTTGPNNNNVVAGDVFSNLYEEFLSGKASVILSVLLTLHHISSQKTVSVPGSRARQLLQLKGADVIKSKKL